jgi:transposase InsO family protein
VLFDRICRRNGITHRLTMPASPNQNGKVERFHGTFRPDFLDTADAFTSIEQAQKAVDAWVEDYNTNRPHQALDEHVPVSPAERFTPVPAEHRDAVELWLPPTLQTVPDATDREPGRDEPGPPAPRVWAGGAVEFDKVVPPSGNMYLAGKQLWLGPARAGQVVHMWADCDLIHLLIGGTRVKTIRSHLSVTDLAGLVGGGAVNAGPSPLPAPEPGEAVEVERVVSRYGLIALGAHRLVAADILAGRHVGVRLEADTLMIFDLDTRELLRVRANPLSFDQVRRLRGNRPAGPPPRPSAEPIRVQRRVSTTGVIVVCRQQVALGRSHQHQTVTVWVSDTTLAVELDDGETRVVRRTTTIPIRNIKANRPQTAQHCLGQV